MEKALKYELEQRITELAPVTKPDGSVEWHIFPTHAPEGAKKPYLVYARISTGKDKNYDGFTEYETLSYMFSCMAVRYADMISLADKVEEFLMSIPQTAIGQDNLFIQDVTINNRTETWENELGVNRGIIDFSITFQNGGTE